MTDQMAAWLAEHRRDRLHRPRWFHHLWAILFGYFWAPCRECGHMYGGHETAAGVVAVWDGTRDGSFVVCRGCGPVVAERTWRQFCAGLDQPELWR